MTLYIGYSKKGLKRQISSRKYWRIFNNDERIRRTVRTYFKHDKQVVVGAYTHNGYVYCQELLFAKGGGSVRYYKVSLLALTNLV